MSPVVFKVILNKSEYNKVYIIFPLYILFGHDLPVLRFLFLFLSSILFYICFRVTFSLVQIVCTHIGQTLYPLQKLQVTHFLTTTTNKYQYFISTTMNSENVKVDFGLMHDLLMNLQF